jgi:hypothetical protein
MEAVAVVLALLLALLALWYLNIKTRYASTTTSI